MKLLTTLLTTVVLAGSAIAGPIATKNPKAPVMPPPPSCDCFGPGLTLGAFGGVIFPQGADDDSGGGGVLAEYFFTENIGIQGSYGVYATNSEHHQFDGSLVLRAPIRSLCIAPYALVGGGYSTNSKNDGTWHAGGGIDLRLDSWNCAGVFADGIYYWSDDNDHTIVRLGVKIPF